MNAALALGFLVVAFFVVAALTARSPAAGLVLLLAVEPFSLDWQVGQIGVSLRSVALAGMVAGLALNGGWRAFALERSAQRVAFAAALVVGATALSYWQAHYKAPAIRETLKVFEYFVAFVACAAAQRLESRLILIQQALIGVVTFVTLLALVQVHGGAPSALAIGGHTVVRIGGPLGTPNQLAGYLALMLPILVLFAADGTGGWWGLFALALAASAEVLTLSRGGILAAIVGIVVAIVATRRAAIAQWPGVILLPVTFSIFVASFFVDGFIRLARERQFSPLAKYVKFARPWTMHEISPTDSFQTRRDLWDAAYRLGVKHPIFGVGAGNFERDLAHVGFPALHTHANSVYIQAAVEGGLPGLLAILWATVLPIALLVRSRSQDALVVGVLGGAVALALFQTVDDLSYSPNVGMLLWMLLGIAFALLK